MVREPALVAPTLPDATPLPSVVAAGWVTASLTIDEDRVTVTPLSGLPRPSTTVTVMAELPPAVKLGVPATTVESAAEGAGAVMLNAAEVALVRPVELATSVYPVPVLLIARSENVATQLLAALLVVPPSVPDPGFVPIAIATVAEELTWLPNASRSSTATAGVIGAFACVLLGCVVYASAAAAAGLTVTVACWVIAVPLMVAETVFASATVEARVPVATPLAFVVLAGWVSVLPLPVAASTTVAPLIGLPLPSFAVTVMVDPLPPAVMLVGEAATVELVADTVGPLAPPASSSIARSPAADDLFRLADTVLRLTPH